MICSRILPERNDTFHLFLYDLPVMDEETRVLSGRKAQAARNDERILAAAREVFVANPDAPISAVAERAGVGISALYRRYDGKEDLLRRLCADGLAAYIAAVEEALAYEGEAWDAFALFMKRAVEANSTALTLSLAGTFEPTEDLFREAEHARRLNEQLFKRVRAARAIRPDFTVNDIGLVLEQIAAVKLGDARRTGQLRRRYLALALDGLRASPGPRLPGPPPRWQELSARWARAGR
jgi:AcrR family transcriptional regulator